MLTKQDLKNHLLDISQDAVFVKFVFVSNEKFSIQLKCMVDPDQPTDYNQYVANWIKKFSSFTATTWIVRSSFPNRKRMAYRKVYACHRSSFNKKTKQTAEQTRNQGCRAKINFRIKFINRNTIKNDPLLKQGLNLTITIEFVHSHKLRTAEAFTLLKSTIETDDIFYSYLSNGYSPTAAKLYHELSLINRYGNNPEYLMNANINPTERHVHYLHKKFKTSTGENLSFDEIMAAKKTKLETMGGFINHGNPEVMIVVTATMRKVVASFSLDHILVDSAIVSGAVVTFLYVPSKTGALPVACVIHAEGTETSYTQAFLAVKLTLDNICNGFEPKLLTLKDCKELRDAANAIFPSSSILISKWSLCCKVWRWINDDTKIESKKRHSIMELFSKLIRAENLVKAEICYKQLKEEESVKNSAFVSEYVDELWEKHDQWLCEDEFSYMKIVEASMRLIDEFIHRKCKSFNVYVMLDVVSNIIDNQIRRILQAHINGGNIAATYTRFLFASKSEFDDLKTIGPNEFKIESNTKPKSSIKFRLDTWCCDCPGGRKGRFCEHLCYIINTIDTELITPCELTDEERCLVEKIAGELEETKLIKSEYENKIPAEESNDEETDNDYCDEEMHVLDNDEIEKQSVTSPKSEANEDNDHFYYLDVKTENSGIDPLEEHMIDHEENSDDLNIPSTSGIIKKVELKRKYEDAMKGLNNEFRRLNKYFKENPNKGNMETMVRLARELKKIRPIERVDLTNMQILMNRKARLTVD